MVDDPRVWQRFHGITVVHHDIVELISTHELFDVHRTILGAGRSFLAEIPLGSGPAHASPAAVVHDLFRLIHRCPCLRRGEADPRLHEGISAG